MLAATKRRAFWALARTDASDLLREKLTWASMLALMLVLLVIHTSMWLAFAVTGSAPRIAQHDLAAISATPQLVEPHAAAITEQLAPFVASGTGEVANVTLRVDAAAESTAAENGTGRVTVTLRESGIGWDPLWQALRVAGMPAGSIDVIAAEGEPMPDFLRLNLGTEFLAVLASVALIGTTVPLVAARERGMLRLLGTTPLSRRLFLASRIPARLALLLACTAGVVAIGLARRYTEVSALPRFAVTVALAAVMLFGVGAVFSARARKAEASQSLMAGISLALVFSAGAVLPAELLPTPARFAVGLLPGSWITEPASADLAGTTPLLPVPAYWALMLVTGIACFMLAVQRFTWDAAPTGANPRGARGTTDPAPPDPAPTAPSPEGALT
ncbi:ABC transporter permease [Leucobacter sp. G161]|uniref:ABC transporter permease n=1 Tax=Leucobacter sp. G161 TaxID=663704 RepID=UPI00073B6ED4|nr:ABC transporter permease [Leucobacter sp. G161]KUF06633.1 hypothetical protein AUL38_11420 [Leucobacter sp. G161]